MVCLVGSKITSDNQFAKTPKTLGILQTECELILGSTLGFKKNKTDKKI